MHVGSAAQTRIYWLTCASKSKRACSGVYVRTCARPCTSASISQRTNAHQFRQSADPLRQNSLFKALFTQWVCSLADTPPPIGGNHTTRGSHTPATRRLHADRRLLMLPNPHHHRCGGCRRDRRTWLRCHARGNDATTRQISHVIYRGHFSRHLKNVAIPTM